MRAGLLPVQIAVCRGAGSWQPGPLAGEWQGWNSQPDFSDRKVPAFIHCSVPQLHVCLDWPWSRSCNVRVEPCVLLTVRGSLLRSACVQM